MIARMKCKTCKSEFEFNSDDSLVDPKDFGKCPSCLGTGGEPKKILKQDCKCENCNCKG
jgi:hypothetical protein